MAERKGKDNNDDTLDEYSKFECESARERLDQQTQLIRSFSDNGYRMLRVSLLIVGAITAAEGASGFESFAIITNPNQCGLSLFGKCRVNINTISKFGTLSLLAGIYLHFLGQRRKEMAIANIFDSDDAKSIIKGAGATGDYRSRLEQYAERVEYNDSVIEVNETILSWGTFSIFLSIIAFTVVSYGVILGEPLGTTIISISILSYLLVSYWFSQKMPDEYIEE